MISRTAWINVIKKYTVPADNYEQYPQSSLKTNEGELIRVQNGDRNVREYHLKVFLNTPLRGGYILPFEPSNSFIGTLLDISNNEFLTCHSSEILYGKMRKYSVDIPWENIVAISYYSESDSA